MINFFEGSNASSVMYFLEIMGVKSSDIKCMVIFCYTNVNATGWPIVLLR